MNTQTNTLPNRKDRAHQEQREMLLAHLAKLEEQGRQVEREKSHLESAANEIMKHIDHIVREENKLHERRRALQTKARMIKDCNSLVSAKLRKLSRKKKALMSSVEKIDLESETLHLRLAQEAAQNNVAAIRRIDNGSQPAIDRRRTPRVAVKVNVNMHTEHNFYTSIIEDISEGGLFVATCENIPEGTLVELTLSLPEKESIHVKGEVRWVRIYTEFNQDFSQGVGIQFLDLKEEDRRAIEHFIKLRKPLLYEVA